MLHVSMQCQILFSKKNKKKIISFSSADFTQSVVSFKRKYILYEQPHFFNP